MNNIDFFINKFSRDKDNILILDHEDGYTENFGKQWKKYQNVQIDSLNNFTISKDFLKNIIFNDLYILKDKTILEIGCGSGRFTEHIVKYAKHCVAVDMSSAIYFNVAKKENNLTLIKADFTKLISNKKFDIIICRGMLQHTPRPLQSIIKLYDFVKEDGKVFFDIYPLPKIGYLHPKYFFWRPIIKKLITYEKTEIFLTNNIKLILKIKRLIKKILFNSNFLSDLVIPIWDYNNKIKLNDKQLEEWSILDTMDGLYAYYDYPQRKKNIDNLLKNNNIEIINYNSKYNCFETKKSYFL